jgi:3-oxoisoapionate decarboxylase
MLLGLGSYAFAWAIGFPGQVPPQPMTAADFLVAARELGVWRVQLCENLPLTALSPADLEAFETRSRRWGIRVDLGTRGLNPDNLRAHLALAQRFGSDVVRLVIDSPGDAPPPRQAVARLKPTVAAFRAAGLKLALENHDRFKAGTLAQMVEELGTDTVGVCLDTANSFGALEGPEKVVEILGAYALVIHLKDFVVRRVDHGMGFVIEGRPAGQGRLNLPWLLGALQVEERNLPVVLETWTPPEPTLALTVAQERRWMEESVAHLRTLIEARPPPALTPTPDLSSKTPSSPHL